MSQSSVATTDDFFEQALELVAEDPDPFGEPVAQGEEDPDPFDEPVSPGESVRVFSNYEWVEAGDKVRKSGLLMRDICADLFEATGGWPKRVDNSLFVPGENYKPRFLETTSQLLAWIDDRMKVDWGRASDMVSQERLLAHLQATAESFEAVEQYPHFPPMPDTYYLHPALPDSDGHHLEAFVDFFCPHTEIDRELIKAFVMGLVYGGPEGSRPAWLITAPPGDPRGGRGVGKSTLIELCSELVGGMIEISPKEDMTAIKTRLLSPAARTLRVARIDNIKTYRFSWMELEGLITAPEISGRRLYQGEGRRPNTLTWALTLNGASLSRDLAQRVMVVELRRLRAYPPRWKKAVRDYIRDYRWHIFNDVRNLLVS